MIIVNNAWKDALMTDNPHFEAARSLKAARGTLGFSPREPSYTAGFDLKSLWIHVRDHKLRALPQEKRTLESHYGGFVLSQSQPGAEEARRLALVVSYGRVAREARIAACDARVYELGPEPADYDIDGRSPAVVAWHDVDRFYMIASDTLLADVLVRIAHSLYE